MESKCQPSTLRILLILCIIIFLITWGTFGGTLWVHYRMRANTVKSRGDFTLSKKDTFTN